MLSAGPEPDLESLFAPFSGARKILVAVSGGPDSMALLALAARWAHGKGRPRVEAATVDHGLRPQSRYEARMVARAAKALGVPHHTLLWKGEKPKTRLQERARDARYALLDACAKKIGADTLFTAHHADDQVETILFRMLRGSGVAGLAGMAMIVRRGDIMHARPLLALPKTALVDYCQRKKIEFVRDPSNEDPRFARTAMRRLAPVLAAEGLGPREFARLADRARGVDAALDYLVAKTVPDTAQPDSENRISIDLAGLRDAPAEIFTRLLNRAIPRLSGDRPRLDRTESLADRLACALQAGKPVRATLGGALTRLDRKGKLTLEPEGPRKRGRVHASDTFSERDGEIDPPSLGKRGREP